MIPNLRRKRILIILMLLLLLLLLTGCEPLDTFGRVLASFTDSLVKMMDSLVNSIRFPAIPTFR